jgi:hypothetical protein
MVGAEGFEPPTLCSQSRCATRLRYAPTVLVYRIACDTASQPFMEVKIDAEQRPHREGNHPCKEEHWQ